jgi:hypothetical protein
VVNLKCEECGTSLPCVVLTKNHLCKECDEQFDYCLNKCKNPCRIKEEQECLWDKWKPEWRNIIDAISGRDKAEEKI